MFRPQQPKVKRGRAREGFGKTIKKQRNMSFYSFKKQAHIVLKGSQLRISDRNVYGEPFRVAANQIYHILSHRDFQKN